MHPYFEQAAHIKWVKAILYAFGLWVVCVLASSLAALDHIRRLMVGEQLTVGWGQLHYFDIYKGAAAQGYTLTVHFKLGLGLLALFCLVAELVMLQAIHRGLRKGMPKQ